MQRGLSATLLLISILLYGDTSAQTRVSIPANTAYAVPAEETNEEDESKMFSEKAGLHNWADTRQRVQFYFKVRNTGDLQLSLLLKNEIAGNKLLVSFAGKNFTLAVPQSKEFKLVNYYEEHLHFLN